MVRHHRSARRRLEILVLAFSLGASARTAHAQAACVAGSFADYVGLAATGCTIGDVRLSSARIPTGAPDSYGARATVTPFSQDIGGGLTYVGLTYEWTPALTVPDPDRGFADLAGWTSTFDVTATSGAIVGLRIGDVFGTLVPATPPATGGGELQAQMVVYELGQVQSSSQIGFADRRIRLQPCAPTLCDVNVWTVASRGAATVNVFAGAAGVSGNFGPPGASATLDAVRFGFLVQTASSTVPEPSSLALVGTALGALAVARRRRGTARR